MVRLKVIPGDTTRKIDEIAATVRDFRPLFNIINREYIVQNLIEIFATDGYGSWQPTSRQNPILRDTRRLYRSYTQPGSVDNISQQTLTRFTYGSSVPYARYHEFDDQNPAIPARPVLGLLKEPRTTEQLRGIVDRWVAGLVRRA